MIRVAYLNTRYPCLSHTFIEREVGALRKLGVEIHTFSVRRPEAKDLLGERHLQESLDTCYLRDGLVGLFGAQIRALLTRPIGYLRGLYVAQRLAPPGLSNRLLHIAYLVEAAKLVHELRMRRLDHVHVHMANNGAAVALLATAIDPSIRYSLTIHGSAEFFNVETGRLRTKVERASFVRCISDFCRAQVMAWTNPDSWTRFHVVHCGIDTTRYRLRPPLGDGPLRILTVGRMEPIKGYAILLEACQRLSERGIDWRLDMVGDGPLRSRLQRQVSENGINEFVRFRGAVGQDEIHQHYARADVLVVSSFMEGVPVVLMEAMATGLAVVSTNVGGVQELVADGRCGLLVRPGSATALAAALVEVANDRRLLESFGVEGRKRVVDGYCLDKVGLQMLQLFASNAAQYVPDLPDPAADFAEPAPALSNQNAPCARAATGAEYAAHGKSSSGLASTE